MKILLIIALSSLASAHGDSNHSHHNPYPHSGIIHPKHTLNSNWEEIQSNESNGIAIKWLETEKINWVRSTSTLKFDIKKVSMMIEDKSNYYKIFDRVISSDTFGDDIVHIRLDMPFPISDRDYVVRYTMDKTENYISYKFVAVNDLEVAELDGSIRLINAAGEWYLEQNNNSTKVVYTWNGELRGDFPEFALSRAWLTQGNEIINWLSESLTLLYGE